MMGVVAHFRAIARLAPSLMTGHARNIVSIRPWHTVRGSPGRNTTGGGEAPPTLVTFSTKLP